MDTISEQDKETNWRKVVLKTDGLKWIIDADETNSSVLEIKEICREILDKFKAE